MAQIPRTNSRTSIAHQVDNATDFNDLKTRLRNVLTVLENRFSKQNNVYFIGQKTDNDPAKYKPGDVIIDSTVVDGAIVIYAFDANKTKVTQSLLSLSGNLPISQNEVFIGDGATKNFNTQSTFTTKSTQVYLSGSRQRIGASGTYVENAVTNKQIQFSAAPANGAVIIVDYELARIL